MSRKLSATERMKIVNDLNRRWARTLTPTQFMVAMAIFDRTAAWGEASAKISISDLCSQGTGGRLGLSVGEKQVRRAMGDLEDLGLISRRREEYGPWTVTLSIENTPMPLRISKKLRGNTSPDLGRGVDGSDHPPSPNVSSLYNITSLRNSSKEISESPPAPRTAREALDNVRSKGRTMTAAKAAQARKAGGVPQADLLYAVWKQAAVETFPATVCVSWGAREKSMVKTALKKLALPEGVSVCDFLEWSIRNWVWIAELEFKWMGRKGGHASAPDEPRLDFFVRWIASFADWFNRRGEFEGRREEFLRSLGIDWYLKRGYTRKEAEEAMARRAPPTRGLKPVAPSTAGSPMAAKKVRQHGSPKVVPMDVVTIEPLDGDVGYDWG